MSQIKDFEEYKKLGEPGKLEKSEIWETAIGLQKVDNLTPSKYLIQTAKQNIDGKISIQEVKEQINAYYKTQPAVLAEDRTEEADKVSARIAEILSEKTFSFNPAEYIAIHKRLFKGVLDDKIVGRLRDYNIEKAEPVLNGETVVYGSASSIADTLDYDFNREKKFKYEGLNKWDKVDHIAKFTSDIWQIHAFGEGNTRTTAVFIIKYLRTLGFKVENDLFAEHSLYFRNALVRANYDNLQNAVYKTNEYLFKFFRNLLLEEKNVLKNEDLQVVIGKNTYKKEIITDKFTDKSVKLSKMEKKFLQNIVEFLEKNGEIYNEQARELTGKSAESAKKYFAALVNAGILIATGERKARKYKLSNKGKK